MNYNKPNSAYKLYKWLLKNSFIKNKKLNQNKEITHVSLAGGVYSIPHPRMDDFFKVLEKIINANGRDGHIYLSEMRTDIFRYMIDIDYEDEEEMSIERLNKLVEIIQGCVNEVNEKKNLNANTELILVRAPKKERKTTNDELVLKTGIHVIFPSIFVNAEIAVILRSLIIQKIVLEMGKRPSFNTWEDVIDLAIYKGAGLRMTGSHKTKSCPDCKGKSKDRDHCGLCTGSGKLDEGRPYKFYKYINRHGEEDEKMSHDYKTDTFQLIKDTSIRSDREKPNFICDEYDMPDFFNIETYKFTHKVIKKKRATKRKKGDYKNILERKESRWIREEINFEDDRYKSLKKFMEGMIFKKSKFYGGAELINLYYCETNAKKPKKTYIFQTDSKYCENVKRYHNSNHVYFLINERGVFQKCHSENQNASGIKCNSLLHEMCKLNRETLYILFPDLKEKNAINSKKISSKKMYKEAPKKKKQETIADEMGDDWGMDFGDI